MLFADGAFDVPAEGNIIDLNEVYEGLLLPDLTYLPVDDVTHLDIKALDGEFVFNKVDILMAANHANDRGKYEFFVNVESLADLLFIVFG
jgi:hypothetical protein